VPESLPDEAAVFAEPVAAGLATLSVTAVEEAAYDLVVKCSGAATGFAAARLAVRAARNGHPQEYTQ